jgi:hypothetical protein
VCLLVGGAVHPRVWHHDRGPVAVGSTLPHPASHAVLFTNRVMANDGLDRADLHPIPSLHYPALQLEVPWKRVGPMMTQVASASATVYVPT